MNTQNQENNVAAKIIAALIWLLIMVGGIFLIVLPYAKEFVFGKIFFPFLGGMIAAFSLYCIYKTFAPANPSDRKLAAFKHTFKRELDGAFTSREKADALAKLLDVAQSIGDSSEADEAAALALAELKSECQTPADFRAVLFFEALANEGIDDEKAISLYKEAIDCDSALSTAYFNIANISEEYGRYDDAAEYYKKASEFESDNQFFLYQAARNLCRLKDFEGAKSYAEAALNVQRDFYPALVLLSVSCAALGEKEKSAEIAKEAIARGADKSALDALTSAAVGKEEIPFEEYNF